MQTETDTIKNWNASPLAASHPQHRRLFLKAAEYQVPIHCVEDATRLRKLADSVGIKTTLVDTEGEHGCKPDLTLEVIQQVTFFQKIAEAKLLQSPVDK